MLSDFSMPVGSLLLIGSLSQLMHEGIAKNCKRVINEVKRFSAMFRGSVTVVPFAPMPLCGISDPAAIRALMISLTGWIVSQVPVCLATILCLETSLAQKNPRKLLIRTGSTYLPL